MTTPARWTPAEDDELRSAWAAGRNSGEIAKLLDVSRDAVKSRARKLGLRVAGSRRVKDDTRQAMDDLAEQMAEGCPSVYEACKRVGLVPARGAQIWQRVLDGLGVEQCR